MYFIYLRSSMNFSSRRTNLEQSHIWWCNKVIKIHDSYIFSEETSTMFYLPPSDNISSFPLFYFEVLTLVFPCAYWTTVIKCPSISLSDLLRHFVTLNPITVSWSCRHQLTYNHLSTRRNSPTYTSGNVSKYTIKLRELRKLSFSR